VSVSAFSQLQNKTKMLRLGLGAAATLNPSLACSLPVAFMIYIQ